MKSLKTVGDTELFFPPGSPMNLWLLNVIKKINDNWQVIAVIDGMTGVGKSRTIGLPILHDYCVLTKGKVTKQDINKISFTLKDFQSKIAKLSKDISILDEASEFNSRSSMSKANRDMNIIFDRIREKKIFSLMILPDFSILDSYVLANHIRHYFNVYRRSRVKYYTFKRIKNYLRRRSVKRLQLLIRPSDVKVAPAFVDRTWLYNGVLAGEYARLKKNSTERAGRLLQDRVSMLNKYLKNCEKCGYQWQSKVLLPQKCPSCRRVMKYKSVKSE